MKKESLALLRVDKIDPDPNQPRKTFPADHIQRLANSIKERGLKQPIKVRPNKKRKGRYIIIMGECRWRAHKHNRAEFIKSIVEEISEADARYDSIIENLQRLDMNPMEEALAYKDLVDRGLSHAKIGKELGIGPERIQNRLNLLELADNVRALVAGGSISASMGSAISWCPQGLQARLVREISAGKLKTVEQVRHGAMALRDAAAQLDAFADAPRLSPKATAALSRLEGKVEAIVRLVAEGFKDGECVAAQRVSVERAKTIADKLALCRTHLFKMEHDLRRVATQNEMVMETAQ